MVEVNWRCRTCKMLHSVEVEEPQVAHAFDLMLAMSAAHKEKHPDHEIREPMVFRPKESA